MTIARVQGASQATTGAGPCVVTLPGPPSVGNLLVGYCVVKTHTVSTWPAGWVIIVQDNVPSSDIGYAQFALKVSQGAGDQSCSLGGSTHYGGFVNEYSGMNVAGADATALAAMLEAASSTQVGSGSTYVIPTVTPAGGVPRLLAVGGGYWDDPATLGWPSPYTDRASISTGGGGGWTGSFFGDAIVDPTSGGSYGGNISSNRGTNYKCKQVSLIPIAGGGGGSGVRTQAVWIA